MTGPLGCVISTLYRVFEVVDGREIGEMVGSSDGHDPIRYNVKKRIYTDLTTARTYKARLAKEGRVARIYRYVQESEVE